MCVHLIFVLQAGVRLHLESVVVQSNEEVVIPVKMAIMRMKILNTLIRDINQK